MGGKEAVNIISADSVQCYIQVCGITAEVLIHWIRAVCRLKHADLGSGFGVHFGHEINKAREVLIQNSRLLRSCRGS